MRRLLRAAGTGVMWATIFGGLSLMFGHSYEAVALGAVGVGVFGTIGLLIGRSWVP